MFNKSERQKQLKIARQLNKQAREDLERGEPEVARQKVKEAIDYLIGLREICSDNSELLLVQEILADGLFIYGIACFNLGDNDAAEKALLKATGVYHALLESASDKQSVSVHQKNLANALYHLGYSLGKQGRHKQEVQAFEEAAGHYHALMELTSDKQTFSILQTWLANSLNNLGVSLGKIGHHEQGIQALEKAVEHYRILLESADDKQAIAQHSIMLAEVLYNLAISLDDIGRYEQAVQTLEQVVEHYSIQLKLVDHKQDVIQYLSKLANVLYNLGIGLDKLDHHDQAVHAYEMAVKHYRILLESADYKKDVSEGIAQTLKTIGDSLGNLERLELAVQAYEMAAKHYQILLKSAVNKQDITQYRTRIAEVLNIMAVNLGNLGRHKRAAQVLEKTVEHYRILLESADNTQDITQNRYMLARALHNLGISLGEHPIAAKAAVKAFEEAADQYCNLFDSADDSQATSLFRSKLARALLNFGIGLGNLDRFEQAVQAFEKAAVHCRILLELADKKAVTQYRKRLAKTLDNLGLALFKIDCYEQAITVSKEAAEHYHEILESVNDSQDIRKYRIKTAAILFLNALSLIKFDRYEQAFIVSEKAAEHYRKLLKSEDDSRVNCEFRGKLADALNMLGTILNKLNHYEQAVQVYEMAVSHYHTLLKSATHEHVSQFRRYLAHTLYYLGGTLFNLGRYEQAEDHLCEADEILALLPISIDSALHHLQVIEIRARIRIHQENPAKADHFFDRLLSRFETCRGELVSPDRLVLQGKVAAERIMHYLVYHKTKVARPAHSWYYSEPARARTLMDLHRRSAGSDRHLSALPAATIIDRSVLLSELNSRPTGEKPGTVFISYFFYDADNVLVHLLPLTGNDKSATAIYKQYYIDWADLKLATQLIYGRRDGASTLSDTWLGLKEHHLASDRAMAALLLTLQQPAIEPQYRDGPRASSRPLTASLKTIWQVLRFATEYERVPDFIQGEDRDALQGFQTEGINNLLQIGQIYRDAKNQLPVKQNGELDKIMTRQVMTGLRQVLGHYNVSQNEIQDDRQVMRQYYQFALEVLPQAGSSSDEDILPDFNHFLNDQLKDKLNKQSPANDPPSWLTGLRRTIWLLLETGHPQAGDMSFYNGLCQLLMANLPQAIGRAFLDPLHQDLQELGAGHLVIAPHGPLHLLPLAAGQLVQSRSDEAPGQTLDHFAISIAPSASVYAEICKNARHHTEPGPALVVGISKDPEGVFADIPYAEAEVHQAAELLQVDAVINEQATMARVLEPGHVPRVIHLATHSVFDYRSPLSSFIKLADGRLVLQQLLEQGPDLRGCRLVMMSSCQSAGVNPDVADEALGLAYGFTSLGARAVIATLWPVDDAVTLRYTQAFYGYWIEKAETAAGAHRHALREVRRSYEGDQGILGWSGFVLIGDGTVVYR